MKSPLISNDAVVFGLLVTTLYLVFKAADSPNRYLKQFFKFFPPILLCYFIPGIFNSTDLISGENSQIYGVVSKYMLPPCLFLFVISLDFQLLKKLGLKALLVFLAGTLGVMIGGPLAVLIVKLIDPNLFTGNNNEMWKGLATVAGSWIGGGANQTALKEIFQPNAYAFSQSVAVDIIVAELWLAVLLLGISNKEKINGWLKADNSMIEEMKEKLSTVKINEEQIPDFMDYLKILAYSFGFSALAYLAADFIAPFLETNYPVLSQYSLTSVFFWVVILITFAAIIMSQTSFRKMEHKGATKLAMIMLYILIASIGMQMDITAIVNNPLLFLVGFIWIIIHAVFVIAAGKILKAPLFLLAVGSQANVGGAASASVVAAAYSPLLIPVGVMLSVLGYAIGTYAGYITALMLKWASF